MSQQSTLSLGQRLVRSTGLQLILVAGSFSLLTYTLGRNSGIQESEVHRTNLSITETVSYTHLTLPTIYSV